MSPAWAFVLSLIGSFLGSWAALFIHGRRAKFCHFAGWIDNSKRQIKL